MSSLNISDGEKFVAITADMLEGMTYQVISSGFECNDFKKSGIYSFKGAPKTNGTASTPCGSYGTLIVDGDTGTSYQIYIPDGNERYLYKRSLATNTWTTVKASTADTADRLTSARNIGLGQAVSSNPVSFNGSANITIPVTGVYESYLNWGGRGITGAVSPIGMALSQEHNANRLAFINGDALTFEYSEDGGTTWLSYGETKEERTQFCTKNRYFPLGRKSGSTKYTINSRARVTLRAQGYVYTRPRKVLVELCSDNNLSCKVELKTGATDAEWRTINTYTLSGLSGWSEFPLDCGTLGGGNSQCGNNWYLRLTFSPTQEVTAYGQTTCSICALRLFGDTNWTEASVENNRGRMSGTGHLYDYDIQANASFPAQVTASTFNGALNGTATAANSLTWCDINGNPTS